MAKGGIFEDTFEKLAELGQSTAKKTVQSVAQTLNPFDKISGSSTSEVDNKQNQVKASEIKRGNNHTPINFDKLKNKFQNKDELKAQALKNRLFQMVRREDEKSLDREKMAKEEKKRNEEYWIQEKKRKEQEKRQQEQQSDIPKGKIRRSVFSNKKTAERQHAELKPATGKQ
jgi:hypothetical protein